MTATTGGGAPLLQTKDLTVVLKTQNGAACVVDHLDLSLRAGETLAIVGESGSGKSMTALSIMGLLPEAAEPPRGQILFAGRDLLRLDEKELDDIRGASLAMIFQEPMTSLNPSMRIGAQIQEVFEAHRPDAPREAARQRALELLRRVQIADPERALTEYPHRLSGGMRQRAMIAMALACEPKVLIADEPTTALDTTVQAQILDLLWSLRSDLGLAILFITHNLGVVAENADRVAVMYAGRKVEEATVAELFANPLHPYSRGLLDAAPDPARAESASRAPLHEIPGLAPPLWALPPGCAFAPRCPLAMPVCVERRPPLTALAAGREVACFAATGETA